MTNTVLMIALVAGGYLLGSIPFGVLVTRLGGAGDLRAIGSGNIGATNVLRTGRRGLAAATLLLDGGKAALAALAAPLVVPDMGPMAALAAGAAAFVGHCYPVWLRFRGGKGVATLLGLTLALGWPIGLACLGTWLVVALVTRISSLGGMAAGIAAPVAAGLLGHSALVPGLAWLALLMLYRHRDNIARLRAGTEPRIGSRAKP